MVAGTHYIPAEAKALPREEGIGSCTVLYIVHITVLDELLCIGLLPGVHCKTLVLRCKTWGQDHQQIVVVQQWRVA